MIPNSPHLRFQSLKKISLLTLLILLLSLVTFHTQFIPAVHAATRLVPGTYPTIQGAIDASKRGDTIQVSPGTYHEHLIVSVTQLKIIGADKATTIIDADQTGTAITLEADQITISGFTIRNGGTRANGITSYTFGSHNISNNIIQNHVDGIYLSTSSSNIISGNTFINNHMRAINMGNSLSNQITYNSIIDGAYGMSLTYVDSTTISYNTVSNTSYGIFVNHSTQNTISNNNEQSNSVGLEVAYSDLQTINNNAISGGMYALQLYATQNSQFNNNTITGASFGIYMAHSTSNNIGGTRNNLITKNDWGIYMYNATNNQITNGNTLGENTWGMYVTGASSGNTIHHNNFASNIRQAYQDLGCTNTWDDGAEGNYWNDYGGYPPASGVDWHPLAQPWPLRNIATTSVTVSTTLAYPGDIITINATVRNFGVITETFTVTAYFNSTPIGTQTTTLTSGSTTKLTYKWNTTNAQPSYYVISATAGPILYVESNYADNSLNEGPVAITFLSDCDNDGDVDYNDFVIVAGAYGSTIGQPAYNSVADFDHDGDVDYDDFVVLAGDYGKHL